MEKETKFCVNCEYIINEPVLKCRRCVLSMNHVNGETVYGTCKTKNWTGDCEDYALPRTKFKRFLLKIKTIFKLY